MCSCVLTVASGIAERNLSYERQSLPPKHNDFFIKQLLHSRIGW